MVADLKAKMTQKDKDITDLKALVSSLEDRVDDQDNDIIKRDKEIVQILRAVQTRQLEKKDA